MKRVIPLLLTGLLAAQLGGCVIVAEDDDGGGGYGGSGGTGGGPGGTGGGPGGGTLVIDNASDFSIRGVYFTSVGSPSWGENLIAGDILAPSESISVSADCDLYDVLVTDVAGLDCVLESLQLCENDAYWRITNDTLFSCGWSPVSSLTIVNVSNLALYEMYVTSVGATTWGPDLLGGQALFPDESITVDTVCDYYDVMVVDQVGTECVLTGIDVCGVNAELRITDAFLASCGFGPTSELTIENASNFDIYEVYLAPVGSNNWGRELLGNVILRPDDLLTIYDIECGVYDAMVVDEFNNECVLPELDLCANDAYWLITDFTLSVCPFAFQQPSSPAPQ